MLSAIDLRSRFGLFLSERVLCQSSFAQFDYSQCTYSQTTANGIVGAINDSLNQSCTITYTAFRVTHSVHNIKNWRFPTEQEAKAIRDRFNGDRLIDLNEKIEARNQEELEITHDSDTRYLCDKEGVFYSFQFIGAKRVTKAGKDKFYLIRVVTTHHFSK